MTAVHILKLQMQPLLVVALTWFLTLWDRHSPPDFEISKVQCNCSCEVKSVSCEVNTWGSELLKVALIFCFGIIVGLGRISLSILYSIIAVISGFCTSLGATSTQTLPVTFARSSDALGGPATRVDPVEAPIEGSNHRRAQEQLALLRQRRASLTTQP